MTHTEALKLALEALEEAWYHVGTFQPTEKAIDLYDKAKTAIKEALAQPEQEEIKGVVMRCADYDIALPVIDIREGRVLVGQVSITPKPKEPEQEPVAWMDKDGDVLSASVIDGNGLRNIPLYTTPPQRTWVGLTEEDLKLLSAEWRIVYGAWMDDFARDIEAKLKDKNT
jgi:hypothetical protein